MSAKILATVWLAAVIGLFGHVPAQADDTTTATASETQIIDGGSTLYDGADEWA